MTEFHATADAIASRCRRAGWAVAQAKTKSQTWLYRITAPDGATIDIPKAPSDELWEDRVYEALDARGFAEAEREYFLRDSAEREQPPPTATTIAFADAVWPDETSGRAAPAIGKAPLGRAASRYLGIPPEVDVTWMMRPSSWPETKTVTVTPEAAAKVLAERNTHNRPLSPKRVAYFQALIADGEFGCTHQGVAMDIDGLLQDGQHRLQAIVESAAPVTMMVSVGMPKENFGRVDAGTNRNGGDTVYVMGEHTDYKLVSSAVKMLIVIEGHAGDSHVRERSMRISNDRLGRALPRYQEGLHTAIRDAKRLRRELRRANLAGTVAAAYLLQARLSEGHPLLARFFEDVEYGDMLPRSSAAAALRRTLQNGRQDGRAHGRWETAALVLKAWNKYARSESVSNLIWRANEAFPAAIFLPPRDLPISPESGTNSDA